jgi:hypothetical protein
MNIFYLDKDPKKCAEMHLDKHVVKMIIEYAQLMSTAHRILDGEEYTDLTANGRRIKRWRLNDNREGRLMKASHINHPSGIWTRASNSNYIWLFNMWWCLLTEYTHRYGKVHSCARLLNDLMVLPKNISEGPFTEPTPAMPDDRKIPGDSLKSYHQYYIHNKNHFAKWTKREIPEWYTEGLKHANLHSA